MPGRSLSLQAYRTLSRRSTIQSRAPETPRPEGELVWVHIGHGKDFPAIMDIVDRLHTLRPGINVLLTVTPEHRKIVSRINARQDVMCDDVPSEHPQAVTTFLDHWKPDLALWVWGGLRPNLVHETFRRNIAMHLIAAEATGFDGRRDRWLPELSRQLLREISTATATNQATLERLSRLGMTREKVQLQQELRPTGRVLPFEASDLDEMTQFLSGRPVWLAAQTNKQEWDAVLSAHRTALRNAHRLLLIIEPADPADLEALCKDIDRRDLIRGVWGDGEWPDETTQVLIADIPDELGLWYRTATVSFLGSSLGAGQGGIDPMEAAALGTAILYGPNVGGHLASYSRLATAGAARIVNDAASLASAVGRLVAPDQAASMAHAGWDVASHGAEVVDSVIDLVQSELDARAISENAT